MVCVACLSAAAALLANVTGCAGGQSKGPAPEETGAPAARTGTQSGEQAGQAADEPAPEDLVQASLLASAAGIAPGQAVVVAARFDIAPEWHLYWENPGESGLATEMELVVPEGFEAGPVRYPGPVRFESPGPVVSYGYAGQVLLSAEVRAPERLAAAEYEIAAQTSWLACKETCVRGSADLSLRLPVTQEAGNAQPAPAIRDLLAAHEARLPRPWAELAGARHAWEIPAQGGPVLLIEVPGATGLSFFPATGSQLAFSGQEPATSAGAASVRLRFRGDRPLEQARGVLRVDRDGHAAFHTLDLPGPGPARADPEATPQP